jgi:hypothetical protein
MKDHPTAEALVKLCTTGPEVREARDAQAHLDAGCPECARRLAELLEVIASLSTPALLEVPEAVQRRALAWLQDQEQAWRSAAEAAVPVTSSAQDLVGAIRNLAHAAGRLLEECQAALVLDSRAGLALPGVRGAAPARQLLFESSAGSIHLVVEPAEAGASRVRGQFLASGDAAPPWGSRATIEAGGHTATELLSESGEFLFDAVPPGTIRISVEDGDRRIVLDPIEP